MMFRQSRALLWVGLLAWSQLTREAFGAFALTTGWNDVALTVGDARPKWLVEPRCAINAKQAPVPSASRRRLLAVGTATAATLVVKAKPANAAIKFWTGDQDRRQLELCLVTVLRVLLWAQLQADALESAASAEERRRKYLEARLGAKSVLTGKVGGGATGKVYTLATLQLPACLADLEWHATRQSAAAGAAVSEGRAKFSEGLAAIVEFDGLEALADPSPRSSLTLAQYNDAKAVYVRRSLREIVVPAGNELVGALGPEPLQRSMHYVQQYYSSELPPTSAVAVNDPAAASTLPYSL